MFANAKLFANMCTEWCSVERILRHTKNGKKYRKEAPRKMPFNYAMSASECMAQHELLIGHSTLAEQYLNCRIHMCSLRMWNVATQLKNEYHDSIYFSNVCVSVFVCVHVGLCAHCTQMAKAQKICNQIERRDERIENGHTIPIERRFLSPKPFMEWKAPTTTAAAAMKRKEEEKKRKNQQRKRMIGFTVAHISTNRDPGRQSEIYTVYSIIASELLCFAISVAAAVWIFVVVARLRRRQWHRHECDTWISA